MDIEMPEMDGLEATRRLKAAPDAPRVVVVSLHADAAFRAAAAAAGADGFVPKPDIAAQLPPLLAALGDPPSL
jgi:CheY-like chemotaxis protein